MNNDVQFLFITCVIQQYSKFKFKNNKNVLGTY